MKKINKELLSIYLKTHLGYNFHSIWDELYQLTGKPMNFECPEYKEAAKQAEKIKKSPLYKALEER